MKKRAITLLLALVMCLSLCATAFASEVQPYEVRYYYKTVDLGTYRTSVRGLPDGQDPGGHEFKSSTRIHYSLDSGKKISGGINVALPVPYNWISFSVNIGTTDGVGYSEGLDDDKDQEPGIYYLMITKYYDANAYAVYRRRVGTADTPENWVIDHTGVVLTFHRHTAELITPAQVKAYGLSL